MLDLFTNTSPTIGFLPHGQCFLWIRELLLLHVVSDSLTALAYYSIPIALVYFVRKRTDLEYGWIFLIFAAFILACGTTHILGVWTVWNPDYWLFGSVKAITAAVSLSTAVLVWILMPTALAIPSPKQLHQTQQELEARVAERTRELAEANVKLHAEITERKRAEKIIRRYAERLEKSNQQLERLALFDDLTGLYNRRHLLESLERAFLTAQRYELSLCVMMLDADHFKQLNDTYGHLTGDRALAKLGRVLRENLRISDIVGRYGGEEFCVALPHTTLEHAIETAEKLRIRIMQEEIPSESGEILHITCSIGIAQWQPSITSLTELLERADYALYQAKAAGRNQIAVASSDD